MHFKNVVKYTLIFLLIITSVFSTINFKSNEAFVYICSSFIYFVTLFIGINSSAGKAQPLINYFTFLSILFIAIRVTYLSINYESINYEYLIGTLSIYDSSKTILNIVLFSSLLILGLIIGGRLRFRFPRIKNLPFMDSFLKYNFIIKYSLFTIFLQFLQYFLDIDNSFGHTYLGIIAPFDILPLILVTSIFLKKTNNELSKLEIKQGTLVLTLFLVLRIITGNKAILFMFLQYLLIAFLVISRRIIVPIKYLIITFVGAIFGVILFFLGNLMRIYNVYNSGSLNSIFDLINIANIKLAFEYTSSNNMLNLDFLSRRLSYFDYLNVFFNAYPDFPEYLQLDYSFKMIWNTLIPSFIPGISFNDAVLFPANLFKVAYGSELIEDVLVNYHSDHLPLFGFLHINYPVFALLIIFIIGLLSSFLFRLIIILDFKSSILFKSFFLLYFGELIFGMGIASTLQQLLFFTITPLLIMFLVQKIFLLNKNYF